MPDTEGPPRAPSTTQLLARLAPPRQAERTALLISSGVIVSLLSVFALICSGLNILIPLVMHPWWTVASLLLAVGLALPHTLVILWLDRNEQEPWWLLASAWMWGAVMATALSLVGNGVLGLFFMALAGEGAVAQQLTASFSAPPVEELTKGAAIALLYLVFRRDFDNVLDGIVYGSLVGIGFAMMENFIYYMGPILSGSETAAADWAQLVLLRGVITGLGTHWCFTALTGAGFGLLRVMRRGVLRWLAPVAGLGLAIFAHFVWNTLTGLFVSHPEDTVRTLLLSIPMAVVFLQLPFVTLVGVVASLALWHEGHLIRRFLSQERRSVVWPGELDRLVPARRRLAWAIVLLGRGDISGWWKQRKRNRLLIQLAFELWHMDGEEQGGADEVAGEHARRVLVLRRQLRAE